MPSRYLVKDVLQDITAKLKPHIPRASREAQLFLMAHLDVDELWLITNQSWHVENIERLSAWVDRRVKNEPFEYIINSVSFYSQEFYIAEGALIPRPETEILIDEVVKNVSNPDAKITFVEVGVGSGIISTRDQDMGEFSWGKINFSGRTRRESFNFYGDNFWKEFVEVFKND